jgi:hypothetical protein
MLVDAAGRAAFDEDEGELVVDINEEAKNKQKNKE